MIIYPVIPMCCPICKTAIIDANGTRFNHRQKRVQLTNGSLTDLAMCELCLEKLTPEQEQAVFMGIKEDWKKDGFDIGDDIAIVQDKPQYHEH